MTVVHDRRGALGGDGVAEPPGSLAIGLDVGGSKIAVCLFDVGRRTALRSLRVATWPGRGGPAVLDDCVGAVESLLADAGTDAGSAPGVSVDRTPLGIGVCELVDPAGRITSAANFDWRQVDLAARFRSPVVVVESDVRSAACGEARLGAGAGTASFVYLTVGTGIAFSLVLGGRPHAGARGNALILGAPPVEATSSGAALSSRARLPSAQDVFDRPEHRPIVEQGAHQLGLAMAWLVNGLDPELIVMGGGLGLRAEYRDAATAVMRRHIEAGAARDIAVVPAALGPDSGVIGAALLAAERRAVSGAPAPAFDGAGPGVSSEGGHR